MFCLCERWPPAVRVDASLGLAEFEGRLRSGYCTSLQPPVHLNSALLLRLSPYSSRPYFEELFTNRTLADAWVHARLLHESHPFDFWTHRLASGVPESNAETALFQPATCDSGRSRRRRRTLQPPEYVERELRSGALVEADTAIYGSGLGYYLVWLRRALRARRKVQGMGSRTCERSLVRQECSGLTLLSAIRHLAASRTDPMFDNCPRCVGQRRFLPSKRGLYWWRLSLPL